MPNIANEDNRETYASAVGSRQEIRRQQTERGGRDWWGLPQIVRGGVIRLKARGPEGLLDGTGAQRAFGVSRCAAVSADIVEGGPLLASEGWCAGA